MKIIEIKREVISISDLVDEILKSSLSDNPDKSVRLRFKRREDYDNFVCGDLDNLDTRKLSGVYFVNRFLMKRGAIPKFYDWKPTEAVYCF